MRTESVTLSESFLEICLNLCMPSDFVCFLLSKEFLKITFFKNNLSGILSVSNSLDPDQARHFVWRDLSKLFA